MRRRPTRKNRTRFKPNTRYGTPNEDQKWFKAHQDDYESFVREPALDFVNDFAAPLKKISPHFVADSRTVGGSLFRIQRDTRFSKDKTPYKLNTGLQFRHIAASEKAPGRDGVREGSGVRPAGVVLALVGQKRQSAGLSPA